MKLTILQVFIFGVNFPEHRFLWVNTIPSPSHTVSTNHSHPFMIAITRIILRSRPSYAPSRNGKDASTRNDQSRRTHPTTNHRALLTTRRPQNRESAAPIHTTRHYAPERYGHISWQTA